MQKPEEVRKTTKTGERLSPTFQLTDVIVLAVILFQLAAALMTKDVIKPLPLMFCFQTSAFFFFFWTAVYPRLKTFSTVWDDMEHLLLMYCAELQSNIKIWLVLTATKSSTLEERAGKWWCFPNWNPLFFILFSVCFWQHFSLPRAAVKHMTWRKKKWWLFTAKALTLRTSHASWYPQTAA